jgi:hypothetical protein
VKNRRIRIFVRIIEAMMVMPSVRSFTRCCTKLKEKTDIFNVNKRSSSSSSSIIYGGESSSEAASNTLAVWHSLVEDGNVTQDKLDRLRKVVDDECVFKPPTYYSAWKGGDETAMLLGCAAEVFGKSFTYGRQWLSEDGREWALEFTADISDTGKSIEGIDLVKLNDAGRIVDFTVLARPPSGVAALKSEMMKKVPPRLAALKSKQAFGSVAAAFGVAA